MFMVQAGWVGQLFEHSIIPVNGILFSGEQHGYNIPEVRACPDLADWLAGGKENDIMAVREDKGLPELSRRLLCDGYMCMYQSLDTMMYK